MNERISGYSYSDGECCHMHRLLLPALRRRLVESESLFYATRRLFDLGCGNGSVAAALATDGYEVSGVDPSTDGIAHANKAYPALRLEVGSGYDDLKNRFGQFPCVYCLEVIEHVYNPRRLVRTVSHLLEPGGRFILSTPYHGCMKNLTLAISGKLDSHFTALWDNGHIKFWSPRTLGTLLSEVGFRMLSVERLGRIPALAMTMLVTAERTSSE